MTDNTDVDPGESGRHRTMRAVTLPGFGGSEVLTLTETAPRPEPLPTEVLVRVHAAGVNPVDAKTRGGGRLSAALGEPPYILGWDVAGTVEEIGFGVTTLNPGDRVFGMPSFPRRAGAYAEYVAAPARHFTRTPPGLGDVQAAGLPLAGLTAWQVLVDTARVQRGEHVLVHAAAGGVGHLAVQIAKARGAYVTGTARTEKHDFLRRLGVDEAIDYTVERFEDVVDDADVVMDLVGDADHQRRSLEVMRPGGLLVAVAGPPDPEVARVAAERGLRTSWFLVEPDHKGLAELAALVEARGLRVEVSKVLPLAEAARAHELIETGRVTGKVVLSVGG